MDEFRLKTSTCVLTTAGLLALRRQISFDCTLEDSHAAIELQKSASVKKSKDDFDLLLSEICTRGEWAASDPLINMIHHELDDDDLNEILLSDPASYSHCQWFERTDPERIDMVDFSLV